MGNIFPGSVRYRRAAKGNLLTDPLVTADARWSLLVQPGVAHVQRGIGQRHYLLFLPSHGKPNVCQSGGGTRRPRTRARPRVSA